MAGAADMPIAIIPARGGSKRVPRKNVREFAGKPMIAWAIEAARASGCFGRVIVSTDDDGVAGLAAGLGAEVPFRRPAELADDHATTSAVLAHAVRWAHAERLRPSAVCCIYATAPLLRPEEIREGGRILGSGDWDFVFAATRFEAPVQRGFERLPDGGLRMLWPELFSARSQDLPPVFHDAAQFYWGTPEAWLAQRPIFGARSTVVEIPHWRSVDIDTEDDWRRAEALFAALAGTGPRANS
jgi:pseudaminic acid cytidylyltransferase